MPDKIENTAPQHDGSFEDAILTMPDIEALEGQREADDVRKPNPDGKPVDAKPDTEAKTVKVETKKPEEALADEDEDFIELPPETDDGTPLKLKLSDVVDGWRKSGDLEKQLSEAKASSPQLPHEIEKNIAELQTERLRFQGALKQWADRNRPQPPNRDLINPQSVNYDPSLFYEQDQQFQAMVHENRRVADEYNRLEKQTISENDAVRASKISREQAEIQKFWPDVLTDEKSRVTAKAELAKHYGIDDAFLNSDVTLDHRIYALAKDALAWRASQAKQAEAVKTVKAKPRLITGQARVKTDSTSQRRSDGFRALQKSGSLNDAADALEGLL